MFKRIQSILTSLISPSLAPDNKENSDDIQFSVALLLTEIMHADHVLHEHEKQMVINLLRQQFSLEETAATELYLRANKKMNEVVSLHHHTSRINSDFSYLKKFELMINLWKVVFADGQVDRYEEHLVRRVADLIYISHKDFIKAKHLAHESFTS